MNQILALGGVVILDDMWMPASQKIAGFIRNNFSSLCYAEIYTEISNAFCVQKMSDDERAWSHFADF